MLLVISTCSLPFFIKSFVNDFNACVPVGDPNAACAVCAVFYIAIEKFLEWHEKWVDLSKGLQTVFVDQEDQLSFKEVDRWQQQAGKK